MGAEHQRYLEQPRFGALDGLRCLSILPVIWHHSTPAPLPGVLGKGAFGVHLFFAISGFLITTLLLRERDARPGGISLSRFYVRRALRIAPLYYAVLALYALHAVFFLADSPARAYFLRSLPFHATYTGNWFADPAFAGTIIFGFSWSLAVEEQFYLVWPWVLGRGRGVLWPAAFMLVAMGAHVLAARGSLAGWVDPSGLGQRMLLGIAPPICLGALLACVLHARLGFLLLGSALGHRASAPGLLAALVLMLVTDATPLLVVHAVMALLVGAVCVRRDHGLARVLEVPLARLVGTVSYGMYLFHVGVIGLVKWLLPDAWHPAIAIFTLAVPLTFAAAWVSYRFFEMPFLALKNRYR